MLTNKDKIILEALRQYCRVPTKELTKLTHLPQPTIVYKIKALEKKGYIVKYDALINHNKLPFYKTMYFVSVPEEIKQTFEKEISFFSTVTSSLRLYNKTNYYLLCYFKTKKEQKEFETFLIKLNLEYENYSFLYIEMLKHSFFNISVKSNNPKLKRKLSI